MGLCTCCQCLWRVEEAAAPGAGVRGIVSGSMCMGDGTRILVSSFWSSSIVVCSLNCWAISPAFWCIAFYLFYFNGYGWLVCLHIYAPHVCLLPQRPQRGHQISLELELQTVISATNWAQLPEAQPVLWPLNHLSSPDTFTVDASPRWIFFHDCLLCLFLEVRVSLCSPNLPASTHWVLGPKVCTAQAPCDGCSCHQLDVTGKNTPQLRKWLNHMGLGRPVWHFLDAWLTQEGLARCECKHGISMRSSMASAWVPAPGSYLSLPLWLTATCKSDDDSPLPKFALVSVLSQLQKAHEDILVLCLYSMRFIRICFQLYACACACIHVCVYTHTYIYTYTFIHTHTHIHIYTHTRIYIYLHIYIYMERKRERERLILRCVLDLIV